MTTTPDAAAELVRNGVEPQRIATGAVWSEGPLWLPASRTLQWSDIPGNRILAWDQATGEQRVHREDVEFTNGRALLADGAIVHCSHGRRALELERDGVVSTIVDRFDGARLNSPNDVAVHPDGSLWFTDPPYGIVQPHEGHPGEQEYGGCYVFRWSREDGLTPIITDVLRPNGIGFSPDASTLYVSDTSAALGDGPEHCIVAWSLVGTGAAVTATERRLLAVVEPGVPDGFAVDVEGRIWSSSGDGVYVFAPDGALLLRIPIPEVVANVCFGGDDGTSLFIAASTSIYRLETTTTGAR